MLAGFLHMISRKPCFSWVVALFVCSVILFENGWFGRQHFTNLTGVAMVDMNMTNSVNDLIGFLERIGRAGRDAYRLLLVLDFALIGALFLFSAALLFRLIHASSLSSGGSWLVLFPMARGLFDVVETGAMFASAGAYPDLWRPLMRLAAFSTSAKWAFLYANGAVVIVLAALQCVTKVHRQGGLR